MLMQRIIFFNATVKDDISQSGCVLRDYDCSISGLVSGWTESYPDMTTHWTAFCINSRTKTWQSLTSADEIGGVFEDTKIIAKEQLTNR